jgi:hypothetical protein
MMIELDDVLDDFHFAVCKIKELEQQNAALVEALEAITGGKEQMVDWCIDNNVHHGVAGWNNAALRQHIATQALALVEGDE